MASTSWLLGISVQNLQKDVAKSSKKCCKILVVLLSQDFYLDGMVKFFIKVVASPILN
jgi:hypothetical protein